VVDVTYQLELSLATVPLPFLRFVQPLTEIAAPGLTQQASNSTQAYISGGCGVLTSTQACKSGGCDVLTSTRAYTSDGCDVLTSTQVWMSGV
jgi:hypothetical protein